VRLYLSTNASALTSSATATLSHDPLPSSMTAVAERPELQSSSQVAQAPASQDEQQDVLAVASAGGVCEAMSGTGNRGSNGGQAEGRSSSCSKCDALVLELEEQGKRRVAAVTPVKQPRSSVCINVMQLGLVWHI
jgi:hypothetical protein